MAKKNAGDGANGALAEQKFQDTALNMIGVAAKLPVVRVDREQFLRQQFAESPHLDHILEHGPQAVFTPESLRKKADRIVKSNTTRTASVSFISGLPANPLVMVPAGGADVVQYFGFAIHMSQQIAYLFGEDDLFSDSNELSEEAKFRVVAYLGGMFGVSGAALLIANTAEVLGANVGKKVIGRPLMNTVWYPILRKTAAMVGKRVTRASLEKTITKAVPVIGGVVSAGLTFATFRPMGHRLADVFVRNLNGEFEESGLDLNPDFVATLDEEEVLEGAVIDVAEENTSTTRVTE